MTTLCWVENWRKSMIGVCFFKVLFIREYRREYLINNIRIIFGKTSKKQTALHKMSNRLTVELKDLL